MAHSALCGLHPWPVRIAFDQGFAPTCAGLTGQPNSERSQTASTNKMPAMLPFSCVAGSKLYQACVADSGLIQAETLRQAAVQELTSSSWQELVFNRQSAIKRTSLCSPLFRVL